MPKEPKPWGSICLASRLEKNVEADFVIALTGLITNGLRAGDALRLERGMMAHTAGNSIIRAFLTDTQCDSLMFIDSDADFEPDLLTRLREYQPGWVYDALQVFHVRRNNPTEPIWFTKSGDQLVQNMILGEGAADVGLIGTHCAIFRREIFTAIYEAHGQGVDFDDFQWFCYPRHQRKSDEVMLSFEAAELGFRLGATTDVRIGHISKAAIGWKEYQEFLENSHARPRAKYYENLSKLVAEFTGEDVQTVQSKAMNGGKNTAEAWERYQPQTPAEVRAFYGRRDNGYLYDLLNWNWTEFYWSILAPLRSVFGKNVLVIGAGLGSEADALPAENNIDVFELPGVLLDFCKFRLGDKVRFLDDGMLKPGNGLRQYDLVIAIDTIEHIHPDELDEFLDAVSWSIAPGGSLYVHNNFGDQETNPMHYDNSARFERWIKEIGLDRKNEYEYRKNKMLETVPE